MLLPEKLHCQAALQRMLSATPETQEDMVVILDLVSASTPEAITRALQYAETCGVPLDTWAPWVFLYGYDEVWLQARARGVTSAQMLETPFVVAGIRTQPFLQNATFTASLNLLTQSGKEHLIRRVLEEGVSPYTLIPLTRHEAQRMPHAPPALPWWVMACFNGTSASLALLFNAAKRATVPEEATAPEGTTWKDWALYALAWCQEGTDLRPRHDPTPALRWKWWQRLCREGGDPCALLSTPTPSSAYVPATQRGIRTPWHWLEQALEDTPHAAPETPPYYATTAVHAAFEAEYSDRMSFCRPLSFLAFKRCMKKTLAVPFQEGGDGQHMKEAGGKRQKKRERDLFALPLNGRGRDPLREVYDHTSGMPTEQEIRTWVRTYAPSALRAQGWREVLRSIEHLSPVESLDAFDLPVLLKRYQRVPGTLPPAVGVALVHTLGLRCLSLWNLTRHGGAGQIDIFPRLCTLLDHWIDPTPTRALRAWKAWSTTLRQTVDHMEKDATTMGPETIKAQEAGLQLVLLPPPPYAFKETPGIETHAVPRRRL